MDAPHATHNGNGVQYPAAFIHGLTARTRSTPWLWPERIPRKGISIVCGPPGLGKSTALIELVARRTAGKEWPDGTPAPAAEDVVICSAEDNIEAILKPRLIAAGADMERIHFHNVDVDDSLRFDISGDGMKPLVDLLAWVHAQRGAYPAWVIFDTFDDYVDGAVDTWKSPRVRRALKRIRRLASQHSFAVTLVTHLNKRGPGDDNRRALERILHSVGLGGVVRAVYAVAVDENENLYFGPVKESWSEPMPSIRFRIESRPHPAPSDERDDETVPLVVWGSEVDVDINALVCGQRDAGGDRDLPSEAVDEIIKRMLPKDGEWHPSGPIFAEIIKKRYSRATGGRRRKALGIESEKRAEWSWRWGHTPHMNVMSDRLENRSINHSVTREPDQSITQPINQPLRRITARSRTRLAPSSRRTVCSTPPQRSRPKACMAPTRRGVAGKASNPCGRTTLGRG